MQPSASARLATPLRALMFLQFAYPVQDMAAQISAKSMSFCSYSTSCCHCSVTYYVMFFSHLHCCSPLLLCPPLFPSVQSLPVTIPFSTVFSRHYSFSTAFSKSDPIKMFILFNHCPTETSQNDNLETKGGTSTLDITRATHRLNTRMQCRYLTPYSKCKPVRFFTAHTARKQHPPPCPPPTQPRPSGIPECFYYTYFCAAFSE